MLVVVAVSFHTGRNNGSENPLWWLPASGGLPAILWEPPSMDTHTGASSPSWLQQRAHPVPTSYHRVEETPGSAAGLQHSRGQSVAVGNLHIKGRARLRCPQSGATGGRPGSFCERGRLPRHWALKSCRDSQDGTRNTDEGSLLPLQLPKAEGEDRTLGGSKERAREMRTDASPRVITLLPQTLASILSLLWDDWCMTNRLIRSPPCRDSTYSVICSVSSLSHTHAPLLWYMIISPLHQDVSAGSEGGWGWVDILHHKLCNWYIFPSHA